MNKLCRNLTVTLLLAFSFSSFAQETAESNRKDFNDIIKWNVTGIVFNNINLQYERLVTQKLSLIAGVGYMIESDVPFASTFENQDLDIPTELLDARIKGLMINFETRFYLGKGYGQGFYISPYYRYSQFDVRNVSLDFDVEGETKTVEAKANVSSHNAGLLLGAQWNLDSAKKWVLDLWILGAHYGKAQGDIASYSKNLSLTEEEQQQLREEIEGLDIPFSDVEDIKIKSNEASAKITGPWGGVRFGVSIGYRF